MKLYLEISELLSSRGIVESSYVSERKIISIMWAELDAVKINDLRYSWADRFLKFYRHLKKYSVQLFLGPGFTSTSQLRLHAY